MVGEDALGGLADLQLLGGALPWHPMRCAVPVIGGGGPQLHLLRA
jgi:hypothetical protein